MERLNENWQSYDCANCDPENEETGKGYTLPYTVLVPEGEPAPDDCPRCGGLLSMVEMTGGLRVSDPAMERFLAERQAAS